MTTLWAQGKDRSVSLDSAKRKESGSMARKRFNLSNIHEILAFRHATWSIQGTARSLGMGRGVLRKYMVLARADGYAPGSLCP